MTSLSMPSSSVGLQVLQRTLFLAPLVHGFVSLRNVRPTPVWDTAVFHSEVKFFGVSVAVKHLIRPPIFGIKRGAFFECNIPRCSQQGKVAEFGNSFLMRACRKCLSVYLRTKSHLSLSSLEERRFFQRSSHVLFEEVIRGLLPSNISFFVLSKFVRQFFKTLQVVPGPFSISRIKEVGSIRAPGTIGRAIPFQKDSPLKVNKADLGLSLRRASKKGECNE